MNAGEMAKPNAFVVLKSFVCFVGDQWTSPPFDQCKSNPIDGAAFKVKNVIV